MEQLLYEAAKRGVESEVRKLLNSVEYVDVNYQDPLDKAQTPLIVACRNGFVNVVKLLLNDKRVNVHKIQRGGVTAFYIACQNGHLEIVKLLLNHKLIMEKIPGSINKSSVEGCNPMWAACQQGNIEIVKLLLTYPAIDLNAFRTNDKRSCIQQAAFAGKTEVVRLLWKDPRLDRLNLNWTPLHVACGMVDVKMVCQVLAEYDKLEDEFDTEDEAINLPLSSLKLNSSFSSSSSDLNSEDDDDYDNDVNSGNLSDDNDLKRENKPFRRRGRFKIRMKNEMIVSSIQNSYRSKLEMISRDSSLMAPVHYLCNLNHPFLFHVLLFHPIVNLNQRDMNQMTPLWMGAYMGSTEFVKWLFASGKPVSTKLTSFNQKTPLEASEQEGHHVISQLIKDFQKNSSLVSHTLRKEVKHYHRVAHEYLLIIVLLCDDYLAFPPSKPKALKSKSQTSLLSKLKENNLSSSSLELGPTGNKIWSTQRRRFLKIVKMLPMELQMVVCYRIVNLTNTVLISQFFEEALFHFVQRRIV